MQRRCRIRAWRKLPTVSPTVNCPPRIFVSRELALPTDDVSVCTCNRPPEVIDNRRKKSRSGGSPQNVPLAHRVYVEGRFGTVIRAALRGRYLSFDRPFLDCIRLLAPGGSYVSRMNL